MCPVPRHYMTECPKWKKTHLGATYLGSASSGLGFYHIELPEVAATRWLNINNWVVVIRRGEISMTELEKELSDIFSKE
jgi:hypothetical protein